MADDTLGMDADNPDKLAADLALAAQDEYQAKRAEQEAFLDAVADEEGAEELETTCTLVTDYTVPLKAKLNGDLMDRMGAIDDRLERLNAEEARAYEISQTADEVAQILDDVVADPDYTKELFYEVYQSEGLDALGALLETAFESLKAEEDRRRGAADGFRPSDG